jgi:homoserine O-succinyltransferase
MPLRLPDKLPAIDFLKDENIFVLGSERANSQDIRPLRIAILNLMPLKITTETDLVRLLSNTPLQLDVHLMKVKAHTSKNTPVEHMQAFYRDFEEMRHEKFDGMIITGAPVEHLDYSEVNYWQEITEIFDWARTHVTSVMYICWAAQAGLFYHYGVPKYPLPKKMFGIFPHRVEKCSKLFEGFEGKFMVPQSRHTTVLQEEIERVPALSILSVSDKTGVYAVTAQNGKQIFITGHSEYDEDTLKTEYLRDLSQGKPIHIPENYFPNDDPNQAPVLSWRAPAKRLFSNWLHYFVSPNADCDD